MVKNISVVLPARNEADNLIRLVPRLLEKYDKHILEIIVVNDCSTDQTEFILEKLTSKYKKVKSIERKSNHGVGLAIREGLKHLSPQCHYVLLMDCDFLANIPDVAKFLGKINSYDGLVGSRFLRKDSLTNYPFIKFVANRSYHLLAKMFLKIPQSDLTNNFKLYKKSLIDLIYPWLVSKDFSINVEIGFYPVLLNAMIGEVAVRWQERNKNMGVSKFKIFRVGPSYAYIFFRLMLLSLFLRLKN